MDEELLKQLTSTKAVTGNEYKLYLLIKNTLQGYVDEINTLKNGSIYALKKGEPGKCSLMLDAHLDEVGLFVTGITEEGFLRVYTRSIDPKVLPGSVVIVNGKEQLTGIIGLKPYHLQDKDNKKAMPIEKLFVDCGLSKKEIEKIVSIGDTISFSSDYINLENNFISDKSLDDRIGVYTIIEVLKNLKRKSPIINIIGHFASQEEITGLGAITSTYHLNPDLAIAIDVTHGTSPDVSKREAFEMGEGPVVFVGPGIDQVILDQILKVANKYDIKVQKEVGILSGTDQTEIQIVRKGIPSAVISIPERYMHTPIEVISTEDVRKIINLISLFIEELNESFLEALYGEF